MSEAVRFEGVTKRFGSATAVDDLDLTIERGEFFSLLGPSGCGKTTTLRMVAGFEQPTEGQVFLDGEPGRARAAVQAQRQHGVPELRAVRPPRRRGQRRVRPQAAQGRGGRDPHARGRGARARAADRARERAPERALRRPAPARRARARARQPARGAAARRAARRARPQAAQGDAGRAQGDPARGRHHVPLRHARPGGGARDVRPDRGHERRRRRAVRDARRRSTSTRRARSWPASSASRT